MSYIPNSVNVMSENKLMTDAQRASFKKELVTLLKPLGKKYGIAFRPGRIDYKNGWRMDGGQMIIRFDAIEEVSHKAEEVVKEAAYGIWDSPEADKLMEGITKVPKKPTLEIYRELDASSFCPHIAVRKDGEKWFSFSMERIQDVRHGDWAGMFGHAQKTRTLVDTFREIGLGFQQEFPDEKELVAEAMEMIATHYITQLELERSLG